MSKVFISYHQDDYDRVDFVALVQILQRADFDIFFDPNTHEHRNRSLDDYRTFVDHSNSVVTLLSEAYLACRQCRTEAYYAYRMRKLIPCALPDFSWDDAPQYLWNWGNSVVNFDVGCPRFLRWLIRQIDTHIPLSYFESHDIGLQTVTKSAVQILRDRPNCSEDLTMQTRLDQLFSDPGSPSPPASTYEYYTQSDSGAPSQNSIESDQAPRLVRTSGRDLYYVMDTEFGPALFHCFVENREKISSILYGDKSAREAVFDKSTRVSVHLVGKSVNLLGACIDYRDLPDRRHGDPIWALLEG